MTHCPDDDALRAYIRGTVSDVEQESVSNHVEGCGSCVERLTRLDGPNDPLLGALRGVGSTPPPPEPAVRALLDRGPRPAGVEIGVGSRLGPYLLVAKLGEGGMGAVYRARHERLGKEFAVKVLPPDCRDAGRAARFEREMKAVGRLEHPHIVRATDAGESDGNPFLVMELVAGTDLSRMVRAHGPFPPARACELIRQAAVALGHAHERGLVHRDVKPSNLLLTPDGAVKLLDLGLALATGDPVEFAPAFGDAPTHAGDHTLTHTGVGLGTRDYMPPEQATDPHAVDARADVYGLGATLHFLLTSYSPANPVPLPPGLGGVVRRMLAVNPAERYASAAAVADAMAGFLRPPTRRRRTALALGVAACAVLAAVLTRDRAPRDAAQTPEPAAEVAPMPRLVVAPPGELPMTVDEAQRLQRLHAAVLGQDVTVGNSLHMRFALIPSGELEMAPRYRVTISNPYRMGTTEVTLRQFREFVKASGHLPTGDAAALLKPFGGGSNPKSKSGTWREPGFASADDAPVTHVSAADADAMADYLTKTEGVRYWVPTEAEWRWACRAGAKTRYPFGDSPKDLATYAVYQFNSSGHPSRVGGLRPNAWGLFDTLGNVREWCADGVGGYPEGHVTDPRVPVKPNAMRVQCGGTFNGRPEYAGRPGWESATCDCDTRSGMIWYLTTVDVGFRLCREP